MFGRRKRSHGDFAEELQAHLAMEADRLREAGMSEEEARAAARRNLGNMTRIQERFYEAHRWLWLDRLIQDLRYGLRQLRGNRGFTAIAVATLALGIGANTAIFSVIDAVLLNPLPYRDAGRLVMLWEQDPQRGWYRNVVSAANFMDWRKQNHVFTQMAAMDDRSYDLSGSGEPMEVLGEQVSAGFFSVLGVHAALGRTFAPEEDQPHGTRVVVLSDELWKQRYGSNPALVGDTVKLNRIPYTVIGVMPPGLYFPPWGDRDQLWTAGLDLTQPARTFHEYTSIARLKPGIGFDRAQAEMDTIARRLAQEYPQQKGWGVQLVNLHEQVVGNTRPALLVLLGAVGLVLLIACANVANLQLARVAGREKEIAIRTALGAGRGRVIRQLLSESMLLAMAGGGLGLLVGGWSVRLLVMLAPQDTPGLDRAGLNLEVLAFTLAISVATGIAFGLVPALGASKVDLNHSLKEGSRASTEGTRSHRARALLVASEFALALVLLVGAGLLIKSFVALTRTALGFEPHNVLTMRIALLGPRYRDQSRQVEFFRDLLRNVESLPGVISAAAIDGGGLPPDGGDGMYFLIEGRPAPPPNQMPDASYRVISPEYFRTLGIPLVRGRFFTETDNERAPGVAIINERLARDYWPGRDPLGSKIEFPGLVGKQPTSFTVVGLVRSVKNLGLDVAPRDEIYVPYSQYPTWFTPRTLLVRTSGDPTLLVAAARHAVATLDKDQPISDVQTMDQIVGQAEAGHRFPMVLLGVFAALALSLAGIGIYGVVSYGVSQRAHEMGIRMALGASQADILKLVLGQGLRLALIGVGFGIMGSLALTRFLVSLLYGVKPTDPLTLGVVSLLLSVVALLACYIPARRAMNVDPITALRYE